MPIKANRLKQAMWCVIILRYTEAIQDKIVQKIKKSFSQRNIREIHLCLLDLTTLTTHFRWPTMHLLPMCLNNKNTQRISMYSCFYIEEILMSSLKKLQTLQ